MSRSLKKGVYRRDSLKKKIAAKKKGQEIKTWSRSSTITPEMIGHVFSVHDGRRHVEVKPTEEMVGHKLGEFVSTTHFNKHGGKMQRDLDKKARQVEIEKAKKE